MSEAKVEYAWFQHDFVGTEEDVFEGRHGFLEWLEEKRMEGWECIALPPSGKGLFKRVLE